MEKTISERAAIAGQVYQFGKTNIESDAKVYERGYIQGAAEQQVIDHDKAHSWLMAHYREYFALRKPISEFEKDFINAMTTTE